MEPGCILTQVSRQYRLILLPDGSKTLWLAFRLFARLLDESAEFGSIAHGTQGLELADSAAGDAHKLLNAPYDCGFFYCRYENLAQQVFQNVNAAYLNTGSTVPKTI